LKSLKNILKDLREQTIDFTGGNMAFDGYLMQALIRELNEALVGGRIDKIHQPERDELTLQIRGTRGSYTLFISVESAMPYFTLTENRKENPQSPPMFCMLMRKHLAGGKILRLNQSGAERTLQIDIEGKNDFGEPELKYLVIEIMGKHSNVILMREDWGIIDSIKRITPDMSRVRTLLPGLKFHFISSDKHTLAEVPFSVDPSAAPLYKALYTQYEGVSPALAKYICRMAGLIPDMPSNVLTPSDAEALSGSVTAFMKRVSADDSTGYIFSDEKGLPKDFYFLPELLPEYTVTTFDRLSQAIDHFYADGNRKLKMHQRALNLKKNLGQRLERYRAKLGKLELELDTADHADIYKIKGELILANLYRLERGMNRADLENYYEDPPVLTEVALDVRLDPSQNAQWYYKRYNKLKTAQHVLVEQIQETKEEIEYLEEVLTLLENSDDAQSIETIRSELVAQGIIRGKVLKKEKQKKLTALTFYTSEGFEVLVGRSSLQNDQLTTKIASKKDYWFHTKVIPGSHVILRTEGKEPGEASLLEAAQIAAYYSKARQSGNVPVDYTLVKNVSKPSGAKLGMVIYVQYKTIFVTPNAENIKSMAQV
jgi:predicted ribosome quality control (RQC) complex YloA/Tae2 family protein